MMIPITSLSDPRIAPYRNVKDKELDRAGNLFIAEGEHLVRRLLASDFPAESVFVTEKHAGEFQNAVPAHVPLYVTSADVMNNILGMKFHSGIIACGRRKAWKPLDDVLPTKPGRLTLVICPDINNVENIGSLIRLSAGFGVDAMILGEQCHDPFWRQSVRVSMGTIFSLPIYRSPNLAHDLGRLKKEWGVELAATVLDAGAEPLEDARRGERLALLLGSEPHGLDDTSLSACDRRITIPMKLGTDSLNVAVAAGIFLYHFTRKKTFLAKRNN
ncbi:MAG TPA: RNA methyltransferase [Tepidisphaeraceae bacterium]|jgi:tRNA G18 (ribose-2'-O)-methylase SpoU|nr:RNA methyltransferase [Tepidisphaeraceae bacterium]